MNSRTDLGAAATGAVSFGYKGYIGVVWGEYKDCFVLGSKFTRVLLDGRLKDCLEVCRVYRG